MSIESSRIETGYKWVSNSVNPGNLPKNVSLKGYAFLEDFLGNLNRNTVKLTREISPLEQAKRKLSKAKSRQARLGFITIAYTIAVIVLGIFLNPFILIGLVFTPNLAQATSNQANAIDKMQNIVNREEVIAQARDRVNQRPNDEDLEFEDQDVFKDSQDDFFFCEVSCDSATNQIIDIRQEHS